MRILVIEGSGTMAQQIESRLKKEGFECDVANNGADGISQALRTTYYAIIVDLELPDTPGFKVISRLRANEDVRILVISKDATMETKLKALTTWGADDYMVDPFNMEEMVARINIMRRHQ